MVKPPKYALIAGVLLVLAGWFIPMPLNETRPIEWLANDLGEKLEQKRQAVRAEMDLLHERIQSDSFPQAAAKYSDYYTGLFEEKGVILAAYQHGELVFWSDNRVDIDYLLGPSIPDEQFLQLENGWYGVIKDIRQHVECYALFQIKTTYPYHNAYLKDAFRDEFNIPEAFDLMLTPGIDNVPVVVDGQAVFYLYQYKILPPADKTFNWLLWLVGLFLLLRNAPAFFREKLKGWPGLVLLPAVLIAFRLVMLSNPHVFSATALFDPALYASSWLFPSLGDLFINGLLLVYLLHFISRHEKVLNIRLSSNYAVWVGFAAMLTGSLLITPLIQGLIENSRINFNLNQIFSLDRYTLLGVASIGLLFFAYYLFAEVLLRFFRGISFRKLPVYFAIAAALAVHILLSHLFGVVDFKVILWPLPVIAVTASTVLRPHDRNRFRTALLLLSYFSLLGTLWILKYNEIREHNERMVYAEKLASEEDPVTELLFGSVVESIYNNQTIAHIFGQPSRYSNNAVQAIVEEQFTDRYWNKYNISVFTYHSDGRFWGILPENRPPELSHFNELIEQFGTPSKTSPDLFHLYNYPDNLSYLAKIPYGDLWILIGLESTLFPSEIGFPALLIEADEYAGDKLRDYSFARYIDDKLVTASGEYNYRINTRLYEDNASSFEFEDYKDFNHLIHRPDPRTLIVVSHEALSVFDRFSIFSYLFGLFGVLLIGLLYLKDSDSFRPGMLNHLNVKIQFLAAGIIVFALLSFGIVTRFYIERQFEEKNYGILSEKIQSVLIETENSLKNEDSLTTAVIDQLRAQLARLSYTFFTDINVYDVDGKLVATSQPRIFDAGLVAPRMNSEAFAKIAINRKSDYIHQEKIGDLKHLSAYVPFRNHNQDILAFINLPYFAQQNVLEEEITRLLVTLVNIFVLLLALSVFATLFITDWITRPLQQLQDSLSRIELGKRNETLQYSGSDVIGDLVNEYNRKVTELELKADQLARSERESAWREMAKQVAHEIKNPLTPMKLKLQMLQKAVAQQDENLEERFIKTSESLIEQIDTLTQIANEFSNFAKMPRAELEWVNLNQLIERTTDLYREIPGSKVIFHSETEQEPMVKADYNQLMRAVQNLIKNGLQAHDNELDAEVNITVSADADNYIIAVTDHGSGIAPEMQDKIFQPNFTTKSTGMGLGLAMVKSIVQNINGRIWFETEQEKGTTFFVSIPAAAQEV